MSNNKAANEPIDIVEMLSRLLERQVGDLITPRPSS